MADLEWQRMDLAPKDGRQLLVCHVGGCHIHTAAWCDIEGIRCWIISGHEPIDGQSFLDADTARWMPMPSQDALLVIPQR